MDNTVAIKAETDDSITLAGWGVVYGGEDLQGTRFTKATDFWLDRLGRSKVVLYDHGFDEAVAKNVIGEASIDEREDGLWVEAQLAKHSRYVQQISKLAQAGALGWSSGAVAHLVEADADADEVYVYKSWPIVEFSLTPTPAEPRTLGVEQIRSLVAHAKSLEALLPEDAGTASEQSEGEGIAAKEINVIVKTDPKEGTTMLDQDTILALKAAVDETVSAKMAGFDSKVDALLKRLEDEPAAEQAGFITNRGGAADPAAKSFGDFLLAVKRGDSKRLGKVYGSTKDLTEGDSTAGGYLVPPEHRADLLSVAMQQSPILGLVRAIPVGSDAGTWPALDQYITPTAGSGQTAYAAGVKATAKAEGATLDETEPAFREINWQVHKIGGYTEVSNELIADSPTAIEALLRMLFGVAVASKREYYILQGSGVGEPLGILKAPCAVGVTTNADNTFAWVDAMGMLARFKQVTSNVRWVMHQSVIPDLAAAGFVTGNIPRSLVDLGFGPPIYSEHMNQANGDDVGLFDFGCYLMFERQSLAIAFSEHAAFTSDKGTWRFTERLDGQPWLKSSITLADPQGSYTVSPFVYHDD